MCVQHQLLGVNTGGQLCLHFSKVRLRGRPYENWSTFFSLTSGSKGKNLIFKMFISDFLK